MSASSSFNEKKYVTAVISIPICVTDSESGEFECLQLQDYSTIIIQDCDPEMLKVKKENVFENLGEKIMEFLDAKEKTKENCAEYTMLDLEKALETENIPTPTPPINKLKSKNKTFRKFNSGRKYTLRNWVLGIH